MIFDHLIDCLGLYYVLVKQQKASLAQVKILGKKAQYSTNRPNYVKILFSLLSCGCGLEFWRISLN